MARTDVNSLNGPGRGRFLSPALGLGTIATLAVNYLLLQAAWFGLTLLFSVYGREAGRVGFAGFLVALLSYLVQVIGEIWPRASFLLPYSPNSAYDPRVVLATGAIPPRSVGVLAGIALIGLGISWWRFRRRDIP